LAGKSWHWHTEQIPGYIPINYNERFLYVGLRDVNETQKKTVAEAGADVIWGDADRVVDFPGELQKRLEARDMSPSLVHLDLDVLDKSVGKVNGFESEGGLQDADVVKCMSLLPKKARPVSFTMCSFNPNLGDGDKIAGIGIRAAVAFVEALIATSVLSTQQ
jgi:arginase